MTTGESPVLYVFGVLLHCGVERACPLDANQPTPERMWTCNNLRAKLQSSVTPNLRVSIKFYLTWASSRPNSSNITDTYRFGTCQGHMLTPCGQHFLESYH